MIIESKKSNSKSSIQYIFRQECSRAIINYASEQYGDEPEYLWMDSPEYAVLRRRDTQKWYALLMNIPCKRLGLDGDEMVEVVDLRFDVDELPLKVDGKRYFYGYHMNKRHWITIMLDGSVPLEEILTDVDKSYDLAKK